MGCTKPSVATWCRIVNKISANARVGRGFLPKPVFVIGNLHNDWLRTRTSFIFSAFRSFFLLRQQPLCCSGIVIPLSSNRIKYNVVVYIPAACRNEVDWSILKQYLWNREHALLRRTNPSRKQLMLYYVATVVTVMDACNKVVVLLLVLNQGTSSQLTYHFEEAILLKPSSSSISASLWSVVQHTLQFNNIQSCLRHLLLFSRSCPLWVGLESLLQWSTWWTAYLNPANAVVSWNWRPIEPPKQHSESKYWKSYFPKRYGEWSLIVCVSWSGNSCCAHTPGPP